MNDSETKKDYAVEQVVGADYIKVQCPNGHQNRGLKAGKQNIRQTLYCAVRGCTMPEWEQVLPSINELEAIE